MKTDKFEKSLIYFLLVCSLMVVVLLTSACAKPSEAASLAAEPTFKETSYIGECKAYNGYYGTLIHSFKDGKYTWLSPNYSDDKCTIELNNVTRSNYDYSILKQSGNRFLIKSDFSQRSNYFVIEIEPNTYTAKILFTDKEAEALDAFDKPITTSYSNYIYSNQVEL